MRIIWAIVTGILALPALLVTLIVASRDERWADGLVERLGQIHPHFGKGRLLVQAASVGEVATVAPLIDALNAELGPGALVLSTMTPTGNAEAKRRWPLVQTYYFPADAGPIPRMWLDRAHCDRVILFETEIWPLFLMTCFARGIHVAIVNGRISDKSWPRYRLAAPLLRPMLRRLAMVTCQTEAYRDRWLKLGVAPSACHVVGNLKLDRPLPESEPADVDRVLEEFAAGRRLVVFASTHEGEEAGVFVCLDEARREDLNVAFVVAPRHKERFDAVAALLGGHEKYITKRRSAWRSGDIADILLLDTHGELPRAFAHAQAAFVGGSLAKVGGHNVAEPAAMGVPVIVGPHTQNFRAEVELLSKAEALKIATDINGVSACIRLWLLDEPLRQQAGQSGKEAVAANRGALGRTLDLLAEHGFLQSRFEPRSP
ncbi:MAG: hypothetical protein H6685_07650 [Deltaproteobacteria bacterium]|nr:hypothetical protein [Deltaproteobacteria bacterium]